MKLNSQRGFWPKTVIILAPILLLLTVINLYLELGHDYGGFLPSWSQKRSVIYPTIISAQTGNAWISREAFARSAWYINPATPAWWPIIDKYKLRYNDVLVALEYIEYGRWSSNAYTSIAREDISSIQLTILRDHQQLDLDIPIKKFTWTNLIEAKLPDLIVGFCFWLLAFAVYRARPKAKINYVAGIALSLFAGNIWLTVYTADFSGLLPLFIRNVIVGIIAAFAALWLLRLALVLPFQTINSPRLFMPLLNFVAIVTCFLFIISFIIIWQNQWNVQFWDLQRQLLLIAMSLVLTITFLAYFFFISRQFWLIFHRNFSRRIRRQSWLLLAGLIPAIPYFSVDFGHPFIGQGYCWHGFDLRLGLLPLAISFAIVVVRYHNFQRLPKTIFLVLMIAFSALLAGIGSWIFRIIKPIAANNLSLFFFLALMATAIAVIIIWGLKSGLHGIFARLWHWDDISYAAVRRFGHNVARPGGLANLPETIVKAIVTELELECAAIWLWNDTQDSLMLAASSGNCTNLSLPKTLEPSALRKNIGAISYRDYINEPTIKYINYVKPANTLEIIVPLITSGQPIGVLGFGKRWTDEVFDERDLEIVDLVAQQAALLLTAAHIDQLRQFPIQIAIIQEKERLRISQELHDTIQQFLGRLPFQLELSRQTAFDDPKTTQQVLEKCIDDVGVAAQMVRDVCNNLAPRHLDKGLCRPLNLLIEKFASHTAITTQVNISSSVDSILSVDARHALYRVVQQSLDNIVAHAKATHVQVDIYKQNNRVLFTVKDNGIGISLQDRLQAEERGSFGLISMNARITSLQGDFNINSSPGKGMTVTGWLPVLVI
ncbi:MAG: GAF domain-containing protein [Deltaproteobacteria bacterium]|nr:GAF domain-containing protein [Deltaproteobacteria bacterium]